MHKHTSAELSGQELLQIINSISDLLWPLILISKICYC